LGKFLFVATLSKEPRQVADEYYINSGILANDSSSILNDPSVFVPGKYFQPSPTFGSKIMEHQLYLDLLTNI
jgi:hypothetical protein